MPETKSGFPPGTLWQLLTARARTALERGALQPIATDLEIAEDAGVRFQIRTVSNLRRKDAERSRASQPPTNAAKRNPFLPYEQDLYVADVSDTHICLLNKFNVIDHHALIVTRAFERQESPLTNADFEALWTCMAEFDALAFYNGGSMAGASQPHKHLQLAPLPLADDHAIPIDPLIAEAPRERGPLCLDRLPFAHAFVRFDAGSASPADRAAQTHSDYRQMLAMTSLDTGPEPGPYNLLVTRRFMLLIPRSRERFETVSINALGFAGSFFVATPERAAVIQRAGPLTVLKHVTFPPA